MPLTIYLLTLPDLDRFVAMSLRLVVAAALGGLLGAERESVGKAAGLRTHMLVALAAALFVLVVTEHGGEGDVGRVIQGIAAGIGFIGAGTILKRVETENVTGLTTAASVWFTAAIGVAAGTGAIWLCLVATICAWLILNVLARVEGRPHSAPPDIDT
ncbi:MAG: MgtC/SapB family protein [Vicinamibacterales bacterium]